MLLQQQHWFWGSGWQTNKQCVGLQLGWLALADERLEPHLSTKVYIRHMLGVHTMPASSELAAASEGVVPPLAAPCCARSRSGTAPPSRRYSADMSSCDRSKLSHRAGFYVLGQLTASMSRQGRCRLHIAATGSGACAAARTMWQSAYYHDTGTRRGMLALTCDGIVLH